MNVLVTGSIAYDFIMNFPGKFASRIMPDKLHQLSLSFLVDRLQKNFGGTAGNIAYTLKLLGIDPLIFGVVGNDFALYKSHLKKFGLTTKYIKEFSDVATGSYFGITDQSDNQIGAFYEGPLKKGLTLPVSNIKEEIELVLISPHDPKTMVKHVKECQKFKLPYLYDPAFQIDTFSPEELREGIAGAQILIGNDYEIALIEKKLRISHEELMKLVPIMVITFGAEGSKIETYLAGRQASDKKQVTRIAAAKTKNALDPTGAGDAYRAGFVSGYVRGFPLKTCGQMGSLAAAYTVETYGTQTHEFTKEAFCTRYGENFGEKLEL